ncbi:MAG: hypothetical protein MUF54_01940 [Polyangiaceae bacterium]|nr:hypothetical protein [Polyangiaceae bacterium]
MEKQKTNELHGLIHAYRTAGMFSRSPKSSWAVEADGFSVEAGVHFGAPGTRAGAGGR